MIDWPVVARAIHVAAVVHWIGGLLFVTFVILPGVLAIDRSRRGELFAAIERRFAAQARVSTLIAGASGFYMLDAYGLWARMIDLRFWWVAAMTGLWLLFTILLFIAEPLFVHAWFDARARRDPEGAFRLALRAHRALSAAAIVTVLGAVAGAHGLF